jgi:DNA repair protein RadC
MSAAPSPTLVYYAPLGSKVVYPAEYVRGGDFIVIRPLKGRYRGTQISVIPMEVTTYVPMGARVANEDVEEPDPASPDPASPVAPAAAVATATVAVAVAAAEETTVPVLHEEAPLGAMGYYAIAVDGKVIGGPFATYHEAKAIVDAQGGIVRYEPGGSQRAAEQVGKPWPKPNLKKRGKGKRSHAEPPPPVAPQPPPVPEVAPIQGDGCLPWVRVTRDPERYEACLAAARKIGPITNAAKVYELLHKTLSVEDQEVFLVVLTDVRGQLRGVSEVHRGQRSRVGVSVSDVMRVVNAAGAEGFLIAHNHPSGTPNPSDADRSLTTQIEKAVEPYGSDLTFFDHVVIGVGSFYSIREDKLYGASKSSGKSFKRSK